MQKYGSGKYLSGEVLNLLREHSGYRIDSELASLARQRLNMNMQVL